MTALQFHRLPKVAQGTLSIACSNFFCAPSKPKQNDRVNGIATQVLPAWRREGIDLVAAQEVFGSAETVPARSGYAHVKHAKDRHHWWHVVPSGLAVFSNHPIVKHSFHPFSRTRAWTRFSTAGIQVARLAHSELGRIDLINTHLQSSFNPLDPTQNADVRLHQLKRDVEPLLRDDPKDGGLVVFLGDLNHHTVDPRTGHVTPEYDFLVNRLHLADATLAVARHSGLREEALFTFGPGILCAEWEYAAAGFKLLFDRVHIGTTNPFHRVVLDMSNCHIEFEDTGFSDHKAVKIWLSLAVYDLGASGAVNLGPRVIFSEGNQHDQFFRGGRGMAA